MLRALRAIRLIVVLPLAMVAAAAGTRLVLGPRAPRWTTAAGALAAARHHNPILRLRRATTAMVRDSPLFRKSGRPRATRVWRRG